MSNRPTGVSIIAFLLILGGALSLLSIPGNLLLYGVVFGGIYSVIGIINLIIGLSMWGMKPWSRQAAIIMQIIGLINIFAIAGLFGAILPGGMIIIMIAMAPSIIISLIVILYLMQGSIKAAFEAVGASTTW